MNIYVGNLSWNMTDEDLKNIFTPFGTVTSAKILTDKMSGRSKGFGFVEMENTDEANAAISNLNDTEVQGRKIVVNESQPRTENKSGGGGYKKSFGNNRSSGGGYNKGGGGGYRSNYKRDNDY